MAEGRGGRGKLEPGGDSSSSCLFHLSIHHNGKRECLKAIHKDIVYRKRRRRREKWGTAGEVRLIHCLCLNYLLFKSPDIFLNCTFTFQKMMAKIKEDTYSDGHREIYYQLCSFLHFYSLCILVQFFIG